MWVSRGSVRKRAEMTQSLAEKSTYAANPVHSRNTTAAMTCHSLSIVIITCIIVNSRLAMFGISGQIHSRRDHFIWVLWRAFT